MKRLLILVTFIATMWSTAGFAQVDPSIEQGIHPFGSYDASKVDTVNLQNGGVSVKIPLFSYPERGKFGATVYLIMSSKQWGVNLYCSPSTGVCDGTWEILNRTGAPMRSLYPNLMGMGVIIDDGLPVRGTTEQYVEEGNGQYRLEPSFVTVDADGSSHPIMGGTMTSPGGATIDGTATMYQTSTGAITARNGVSSASSSNPPYLQVEDPNGNIEMNTAAGTAGQDSMGRAGVYSAFQNAQTLTPTGDNLQGCSGPLAIADVKLVTFPGPNGTTRQLKLCSVTVTGTTNFGVNLNDPGNPGDENPITEGTYTGNVLQSVTLYNGTDWAQSPTWIFQYSGPNPDGSNYLDLTQITFPTGGTISYTLWDTESNPFACGYAFVSRYLRTRTVSANDGSPAEVSSYSYFPGPTTVTDAQGNIVKHYFGSITSGTCNMYETDTAWYNSANQLLKNVQTDYSGVLDPFFPETQPNFDTNVFPIRTTTTLANGMVSKVEKDYDSTLSITYWDPNWVNPNNGQLGGLEVNGNLSRGLVLQKREYAYGNGAPGPLVRCTAYDYEALDNSQYLAANLLDLPSSVKVYAGACGSGTLVSQTTNGYDESSLQSSGVNTQHDGSVPNPGVRGNQTSIHKWLNTGGTINASTGYWDTGMPYQSTDGNGNTTTYTYSSAFAGGLLTQTQMPTTGTVQHIVSGNYDPGTGLLTSYTDQNNNVTNFGYDGLSRMISASFPDTGLTTLQYPDFKTVIEIITDGKTTTTEFDGLGRKSHLILADPDGNDTTDYTYDSVGNLASVSNPYRSTSDPTYGITYFTYDALGQKLSQVQQDGSTLTWIYNAPGTSGGDVTDSYDETNRHWQRTTDAFGNLIKVLEPDASNNPTIETDYQYDTLNNLVSVNQLGAPSGGLARSFTYDSLSRLVSAANPETGTTSYTYDNNGNLATKTDARGIVITYCPYDGLNRVTCKSYSDGTPSVYFTYDQPAASIATMNLGNYVGRLSQAYVYSVQAGITIGSYLSAGYDPMGRPEGYFECPGDSTCVTNGLFPLLIAGQLYTLSGDIAGVSFGVASYISQQSIVGTAAAAEYTYDAADRLSFIAAAYQINDVETSPVTLFSASSTAQGSPSYGPMGLLNAQLSLNSQQQPQIAMARNYDKRGRIIGETDLGGPSLTQIYGYTVGYAGNGNVTSFSDQMMGSWSFGYDSLNRLTSGSSPSGIYSGLYVNWAYDNLGNRLSQTPSGTTGVIVPAAQTLSYNASNQVNSPGYTYDAAGNLLNDGTNQYLYDGEGRLCAVQTPTALTGYVYDGLGRRVGKGSISSFSCNVLTNGFTPSAEYIVGLNGEQLGETDGGYNLLHSNVFAGGHLLATYENSNWYYALNDWLGTKRVEANADGSVAAAFVSLPFGDGLDQQVSGPDATEHHFTGKERDAETGNDYFGARYYGSTMGRFLSPDYSDTPQAMPYADLTNPQSFNRYVYLNDNPLGGVDADGHGCNVPIQADPMKAGTPIEKTPCKSAAAKDHSQIIGGWLKQQVAQGQKWATDHPRTMSGVKAGIAAVGTGVAVAAIIATAPVSVPATLGAAAVAGLSGAALGIGAAGGFVATVTYATGAISGETKAADEAADGVQVVANASGMATLLGTGGNMKAASKAADVQDILTGGPEKSIPAAANLLLPQQ